MTAADLIRRLSVLAADCDSEGFEWVATVLRSVLLQIKDVP